MILIIDDWHNLYNGSWKGTITDSSFAHPAKYSRKLIYKIYQHMKDMGWISSGSTVLDPFGGVGLGALYAITSGYDWIGIEVEPKFAALAMDNISLWEGNFRTIEKLGSAKMVLGDSRFMTMPEAQVSLSSPPYGDISQSGGTRNLIERGIALTGGKSCFSEYGDTPGQLGKMKMKDDDIDTFWNASRLVVTNVFNALSPGGHAIWVVKDYVKAKKLVPFCEQWRSLCEDCGFITEHKHRSWMVNSYGSTINMEGERIEQKKSYKSFFRTLNETKRGLPPIDYEIVWCMVKPDTTIRVENG